MKIIEHDPDANLDYQWDWSAWLDAGEIIVAQSILVDDPDNLVTAGTISFTDTSVTAWLSGGRAGRNIPVTCRIGTNAGREDDRTIVLECVER